MTCIYSGLVMGDMSTPVAVNVVYLMDGVYHAAKSLLSTQAPVCKHSGCYWMILK